MESLQAGPPGFGGVESGKPVLGHSKKADLSGHCPGPLVANHGSHLCTAMLTYLRSWLFAWLFANILRYLLLISLSRL